MRILRNLPRLLAGALLLGIAQPALAGVFCVNTAASLQTALTTAASNGVDDEVRIVQGTYVGNFVYASTQANGLSVLGGYTAGCASRTLNPVNTILDGNQTNRVLVLSAPDAAADFLVEGLTLRNGKRTAGAGGGLLATVGSDGVVTLNNNQIENNTTVGYSYEYPGGGAFISATTATLTNNNITGNTGGGGSGGATIYASTAMLINNNFTGNSGSNFYGGGAEISATTATLTNNHFTSNTAGRGGGVSIAASTTTLTNNNISGNTAGIGGGASIGTYYDANTATLTNNNITGNTAGGSGGGVFFDPSSYQYLSVRLTNNNITGNTAGYEGGAVISAITATLTNNTLVGNAGSDVGGLYLQTGTTETTDSATLYKTFSGTTWPATLTQPRTSRSTTTPTATTSRLPSLCSPIISTSRRPALRSPFPSPWIPLI